MCRLCALMREGRADQIEELYRDRIKAIKTFRQQNYDIHEDVISQVLMPEVFQNNFSAVKTKGDGNCLYNAAAMGIGGILSQHTLEMHAKIVSEYNQEIPQSQTADNPVAPRGRAAQTRKVCFV